MLAHSARRKRSHAGAVKRLAWRCKERTFTQLADSSYANGATPQ